MYTVAITNQGYKRAPFIYHLKKCSVTYNTFQTSSTFLIVSGVFLRNCIMRNKWKWAQFNHDRAHSNIGSFSWLMGHRRIVIFKRNIISFNQKRITWRIKRLDSGIIPRIQGTLCPIWDVSIMKRVACILK